ncbi:MAG: hypothetical protein RIT27_1705 [Pseudomonadota bacterium]|jgi:hypothetical protein
MTTTTLEDVWALFRETDRIIKENAKETDRKFQETDLKFQETDRIIKENAQAAEKRSQEAEKRMQELDRFLKQQTKELNRKMGDLGNRLGDFVEAFVEPAVVKLFQQWGLNVHVVSPNVRIKRPEIGLATEIDLLVSNGDTCVLVEVKSNLSIDDVNEHLERMNKFKQLLPEYAHKKAFGAVAGMVISDRVAKYAYERGFFVIGQSDDIAVILNESNFIPTAW